MPTADSTLQKVKKKKSKKQDEEQHSDMEPETSTSTFKPPPGFQEMKYNLDAREFDWDAFDKNPDLELWAIRLPSNARALVLSEVVTSGPVEATVTEPDIGRLPLPSSTRHSHPAHLLKHKFVPTAVPNDAESIQLRDRDVNAMDIVEEDTNDNRDPEPSSPRKHKKRKKEDLKAEQISKRPRVE
ncbi:SubName: Full=Uncharacterized protein {ECO:0000313/EMBL:CCA69678.1} [Serendipita indica DSM 11827]|nr:SubName: Full=Uncharacterized protein {ECO:0000313/EMBL:CCA69678.1} [Serendipita indica DSM 11827]